MSLTCVTPSATRPARISPAPARMSLARTGAPESRAHAADDGVVPVGAHVGAEPGQLAGEHEPALEDVLGDHRRAVGDRVERHDQRLQVGGEARVGQRHDVDRGRPAVHHDPEAVVGAPRRRARAVLAACPARSRGARGGRRWTVTSPRVIAAANAQVPGDDPVGDDRRAWSARAGRRPRWSASTCRRRRSGRPSAAASGRGRRSPARGPRCR